MHNNNSHHNKKTTLFPSCPLMIFLKMLVRTNYLLYKTFFPTTSNAMEFYKLHNCHLGIYEHCYHYFMFPTNCQNTTCIYIY